MTRADSTKLVVLGLAAAAMILGVLVSFYWRQPKENPFELDLSRFADVDPALIGYDEAEPIKLASDLLFAIAVAEENLYVAGDNSLSILNLADGSEESRIELGQPATCIAVGPSDRVYLGKSDHVEVFDRVGGRLATWEGLPGQAMITSIAATGERVFVADAGNHIVLSYDLSGTLLARIGEKDLDRGISGFIIPSPYFDVAIDPEGHLWVVNPGRHTLESYSAEGDLRTWWGETSIAVAGFCGCCNPTHIVIAPDGSFITSEKGMPRVKVYDRTGHLTAVVAGPEHFAESAGASDLAIDSSGRILVLDPAAKAIRVFVKKPAV